MDSLELKDIAGYFPYGLHVFYRRELYKCVALNSSADIKLKRTVNGDPVTNTCSVDEVSPVLYPLDDIYRTVIHNGEEIIPIVECAKIAMPRYDCVPYINEDGVTAGAKISQTSFTGRVNEGVLSFVWSSFYLCLQGWPNPGLVPNQYQLFDYLHELKIDFRGLIEADLAVNAHCVRVNPYQ
ncbi:MAG: hypothetical protein LBF89_11170 [Bacteroidales bacterium]|jgi:hypothetical protein|nr:hypothetical protein [Bacteroidales bacterium]